MGTFITFIGLTTKVCSAKRANPKEQGAKTQLNNNKNSDSHENSKQKKAEIGDEVPVEIRDLMKNFSGGVPSNLQELNLGHKKITVERTKIQISPSDSESHMQEGEEEKHN